MDFFTLPWLEIAFFVGEEFSFRLKLTTPLDIIEQSIAGLVRVGSRDTGEPYFGQSAGNRFDDPRELAADRFGTCYLGVNLRTAIAESVDGRFQVAATEWSRRWAGPLSCDDAIPVLGQPDRAGFIHQGCRWQHLH